MNKWIENVLLPLVCAFGFGVVTTLEAVEHARQAEIEDAAAALAETQQYSECPPYGYPVTAPVSTVAEVRP